MPEGKGYRVERLRRRRRGRVERWQALALYGLAVLVAFVAVIGAWRVADRFIGSSPKPRPAGHLTLLQVAPRKGAPPVAAALAVKDAADGSVSLFVVPRDLLLEGPHGEYVFAGDAMTSGSLKQDLQRVIDAPIDAVFTVPADALRQLTGAETLPLSLDRPVTLDVAGTQRTYKRNATVPTADLPALLEGAGATGSDAATMQQGLWQAVLRMAALRPAAERRRALAATAAAAVGRDDRWFLRDSLKALVGGDVAVSRVPSTARVSEGQFAFVPDPEGIMREITRRAPGYRSRFTVLVRNGSGEIGIGDAVRRRLAELDVNLPSPANADSFDYRKTEILVGKGALRVAEDVRAILGRGVVLEGSDLPPDTVMVVVGRDLKVANLGMEGQQ
jgi:LytR cell envelope-related transcriptional attenuator